MCVAKHYKLNFGTYPDLYRVFLSWALRQHPHILSLLMESLLRRVKIIKYTVLGTKYADITSCAITRGRYAQPSRAAQTIAPNPKDSECVK